MKLQRNLSIADLLGMKLRLLGRRLEHITGPCSLMQANPTKWEVWDGVLNEIALVEYSGALLIAIEIRRASRLVSLHQGSYLTEAAESRQFEFNPFDFQIYEWDNDDISIQAGKEGLDDLYLIKAPQKLLYAALYRF